MQISVINTTPGPTISEIFFVEKCLELLYHGTIESYRLQLHNPRTILKEVVGVTKSLSLDEITNDEHVRLVAAEALDLFGRPTYLNMNAISKNQMESVFKAQKTSNYVSDIFYTASLLLHDNPDYTGRLFNLIVAEINRLNASASLTAANLSELARLIGYFLIELREAGYSKRYLHKFISQIYFSNAQTNFHDRLQILNSLITRQPESYEYWLVSSSIQVCLLN